MSLIERLKRRKMLQWAIAYSAVAWGALQVLQFLSDAYAWSPVVLRAAPALLAAGLLGVVVVAWFHGEQGQQRPRAAEVLILLLVLVAGIAAASMLGRRGGTGTRASESLPLVIMMDSPDSARVYDRETAEADGTNADVISDILLDLPIRRQKETIGRAWHRDEEIRQFNPDLVLIHLSGFCAPECNAPEAVNRLKLFLSYFDNTKTQFLIYSRLPDGACNPGSCETKLRFALDSVFAGTYAADPTLQSRIHAFGVKDYGAPYWRDPTTSNALKLRVRKLLQLT